MANAINLGKVMGSRMLFVTSPPSPGTGLQDDWAFDTASGKVWQKTSAGWVYRGNIKEGSILSINGLVADSEGNLSIGAADVGAATPQDIKKAGFTPPGQNNTVVLFKSTTAGSASVNLAVPENGWIQISLMNDSVPADILCQVYIGGYYSDAPQIYTKSINDAAYNGYYSDLLKIQKGVSLQGSLQSGGLKEIVLYKEV